MATYYSLQLQGRHDELHEQYTKAQEQLREVGRYSGLYIMFEWFYNRLRSTG